jgi:hypothetical protein
MKTINTPFNVSYEFIGTDTISYEEGDTININGYNYSFDLDGETHNHIVWLDESNDVETTIISAIQNFVDYYNQNL